MIVTDAAVFDVPRRLTMNKALVATLTLLAAATAHAQSAAPTVADGAAPADPPNVYDAHGREIGALSHFSYSYGVLVTKGHAHFVVPLDRNNTSNDPTDIHASASGSQFLYRSYDSILYFTSADCSGNPIIFAAEGPTPTTVIRDGTTVTAYVAGDTPYQTYSINSSSSTQTHACTTLTTPTQRAGWSASGKFVLSQEYPEPLTVSY
jgi:hypothetical protein